MVSIPFSLAGLKSFSEVSKTWSSVVQEHKASRIRLQSYHDLDLALQIQQRENTPLDRKSRRAFHSLGDSSLGHYSASSDLNRSFLGSDTSYNENSIASMYTPEPRIALKPVLRQASVNSLRLDDSVTSLKQTRLSQLPRSRPSRAARSPRTSAGGTLQSPSRHGLPSQSRRGVSGQPSPSRRAQPSPSRRSVAGLQSPSRRSGSGNADPSQSPRSPYARVLSPCRAGAQSAPRFGQRRLFTSPSKSEAGADGKPPLPTPGALYTSAASSTAGRPKLLIAALENNARASPQPSLESSSRRLFDSPTTKSSSGYDLRSQGQSASSAASSSTTGPSSSSSSSLDAKETRKHGGGSNMKDPPLPSSRDEEANDVDAASVVHSSDENVPLRASTYQPSPAALPSRRSLAKNNKSSNKSKQKLRRL